VAEVKWFPESVRCYENHGGKAIMWKTGHSLIKDKIREEKAALGGEMSGHIFFADRYLDMMIAIYASCRLVELLQKQTESYLSFLRTFRRRSSLLKFVLIVRMRSSSRLWKKVKSSCGKTTPSLTSMGFGAQFREGWGLVRASNTQPVLVLRFEAATEEGCKRSRDWLKRRSNPPLPLFRAIKKEVFTRKG